MHYTQILDRLQQVRPSLKENSWTARCPAHEDRAPSLSITVDFDGKTLLHCFAGCHIDAICAALQIELKDLYPDRPKSPRASAPYRHSKIPPQQLAASLEELTVLAFHTVNALLKQELTPEEHQKKMLFIAGALNYLRGQLK